MQETNSIVKKWVPKKLVAPLFVLALFPHLMLLTIFSMNSTFTASFLDLEVDDLQFMFSLAYATIVCGLFIHVRFFQYFNIRSYLLFMTMFNIVILFLITLTTNTQILLILRLLQGPLMLFEGCILLPIIMSNIESKNAKIISFSCLYAYMMTGDKFATSIVKFAIENYNHNMIVYTIIIFHVFALILYAIILNHNRMFEKKPLYQLNLGGIFLMLISLVSGSYCLIYGKKLYWFESTQIVLSFASCLIFSALFIIHQKTSKRPLFHFDILKSPRVIAGIILFFFFYLLRSSLSNIYQVMAQIWKWPWEYVLQIQYFNVAGTIFGVFISYILLVKKVEFKYIFIVSFSLLGASMLWFSYLFVPDIRVDAIVPVLALEGIGQGMLFTPLVFFMLGSVHQSISGSVSQSGTAVRFWTNTIGFSIMQNAVLHLTTKHQFLMVKNLDKTNPIYQEIWNATFNKNIATKLNNDSVSLTVSALRAKLYNQALLVSNIEIFRTLFVVTMIIVIFLIVYHPIKKKLFTTTL
jgi:MFS transporter, DHA2 family, multidrug resistance protein